MLKLVLVRSLIVITLIHYYHHVVLCLNTDTINTTTVLTDPDSIDSSNKQFSLGFFSPNGTTNRFLGIWYHVSPQTITWVSNRENPLKDSSGSVSISSDGNIVLLNGNKEIVWSSNITSDDATSSSSARILDTGNLVLRDDSSGNVLWESYKHPVDTLLPTMRVSQNPRTGERLGLDSWKSPRDPSPGNYTCGLQAQGIPQIYIWDHNGMPRWRSGPWNGRILTGVANMFPMYVNSFNVETSDDGTVYFGKSTHENFLSRNYLTLDGLLVEAFWDVKNGDWNLTWSAPKDKCDFYNKCGAYAVCYSKDTPVCSCLKGYEPKNREEWSNGIWRSGCKRRTLLQCERDNNAMDKNRVDGFSRLSYVKVPDFMVWIDGLENECENLCLKNCSCMGFGYDPGIGCMYWSGDLIDIQRFDGNAGTDFYIRVAYSELDEVKKKKKSKTVVIAAAAISSFVVSFLCLFLFWWTRKPRAKSITSSSGKGRKSQYNSSEIARRNGLDGVNIDELPLFSYEKLANATNNFDMANKLGMGGFGPVYKGTLENGREIAVKRLSAISGQGVEEFTNEVIVISKLQHRNLIRLLGCCVEKGEKILVYEYLKNKSLDVVLFDMKQDVLDWKKRFDIIEAIGRGLLYLHRDSRLKIIHRDLKPSNILLDEDWMPKISDFGMARIFGGNQDQANTAKVVGTYGYMAPEYAVWGRFSEKSDVFSFGVLILEIVSGKRNTSFYNDELSLGLLGYAWKLWNEGVIDDFVDVRILSSGLSKEIMRCINIGLLCVQESTYKRPSISTVVSMLISEIVDLPKPEHPGFTDTVSSSMVESSSSSQTRSTNKITLTVLEGR